jgi:hypothetical protein
VGIKIECVSIWPGSKTEIAKCAELNLIVQSAKNKESLLVFFLFMLMNPEVTNLFEKLEQICVCLIQLLHQRNLKILKLNKY